MTGESPLNLIVVEQDTTVISRLELICREAGYTVNALQASTLDGLRDALHRQAWDLILTGSQLPGVSVAQVTAVAAEKDGDVPVVAIAPPGDDASITQILHAGVRDVAALEPYDRLLHIIKRELADLRDRRALRHYKKILGEYEQRLMYFLGRAEKRQGKTSPGEQTGVKIDTAVPTTVVEKAMPAGAAKQQVSVPAAETALPAQGASVSTRSSFLDALSRELIGQSPRPGHQAVLYIELDKGVMPAESWDQAAVQDFTGSVETLLRNTLSAPYLMTRYDDFVFIVLISHGERQGLVKTAHSVKQAIESSAFQVGGREINAVCSIGACLVDQHSRRASGLIANAKAACDKATAAGGKRIVFTGRTPVAAPSVTPVRAPAAGGWADRLQAALNADRFRLVFQPVIHFHAEPTETYEILLRMIDERGGEIMPGTFIPKAEESGMMQDIDRWVVKTAAAALQQRRETGYNTRLFVKLSAASVDSQDFPSWLEEMLKIMRLPAESLVFQFSEPMITTRRHRALEFIQRLVGMGCTCALDHFGMQKNSLDTAQYLPVKYLKIHGDLIQSLARDVSNQRLLKEIVDQARATGKVTIASFVQDPYILSILWRSRVDYVQGFYFQPPKPAMVYDFSSAIS